MWINIAAILSGDTTLLPSSLQRNYRKFEVKMSKNAHNMPSIDCSDEERVQSPTPRQRHSNSVKASEPAKKQRSPPPPARKRPSTHTASNMPSIDCSDEERVQSPTPRQRQSNSVKASELAKKQRSPPPPARNRPSTHTVASKKRKITPVVPHKKYSQYELFGTDSEDDDDDEISATAKNNDETRRVETTKKQKRSASHDPHPTRPSTSKKTSARDLFGSDSDDDTNVQIGNKKSPPLVSFFTKRVASGISKQTDNEKKGSHFIELKVYNCDEISNVQPMNRWRHAIITVKNRTNDDSEAWTHLTEFIKATRREFRNCRPDIINGC